MQSTYLDGTISFIHVQLFSIFFYFNWYVGFAIFFYLVLLGLWRAMNTHIHNIEFNKRNNINSLQHFQHQSPSHNFGFPPLFWQLQHRQSSKCDCIFFFIFFLSILITNWWSPFLIKFYDTQTERLNGPHVIVCPLFLFLFPSFIAVECLFCLAS